MRKYKITWFWKSQPPTKSTVEEWGLPSVADFRHPDLFSLTIEVIDKAPKEEDE